MEVRIDKWLWAVRIFKTRTIALEACKKNRILVNDAPAKPSRMIRIGDIISVRKPPVTYSFKVLGLTSNRIGAKLVPEYVENITPPEQYEILNLQKISGFIDRAKGTGRPTKKERRNLDEFSSPTFADDMEFNFDE
ncbi:MAG: RNA-binding S4 domain-containing protein [Dysgonamonadaceae bacterium]|jgi:ribosome-associated heat shock protein Hsp15|nr:RNA-binding S4 domain-containing protein [Dysgonamonadaceae bacterium]